MKIDFIGYLNLYCSDKMDKVEEVVGLEPTHVGFAIRGITSFAIPPTEMYSLFFKSFKIKKVR